MAQNKRTPTKDVINIAITVGIPDVGTFGPVNEQGLAAYGPKGPDRRIYASGNYVLRRIE
jgi:hypothetical protein